MTGHQDDDMPVVTLEHGGIVVGETFTEGGRLPLRLPLIAPRGPSVTVVGGLHLAALMALRAGATGTRVSVETARRHRWRRCLGATVDLRPPGAMHVGANAEEPVLLVRDLGARPPQDRSAAQPWRTVMTLLPYIEPTADALLAQADVVGLQRLSPAESDLAAGAIGLDTADRHLLPALSDVETLWCSCGRTRRALSVLSGAEAELLGAPQRVD